MRYTIHPSWVPFFDKYKDKIDAIVDSLQHISTLHPPINDIFKVFDLIALEDVKIVIINDKPSSRQLTIPMSLPSIQGPLITFSAEMERTLKYPLLNPSLKGWISNGILPLNYSMTTQLDGEGDNHLLYWKHWMRELLRFIVNDHSVVVIFLGSVAAGIKNVVPKENCIEAPALEFVPKHNDVKATQFYGSDALLKCQSIIGTVDWS